MKITAVDSAVLAVPTPRPMSLEFREHRLVVAHVHTDEGLSGLGYSLAFGGGGAEAIQVYLETRLAPLLVGEDPRLVERLWERMYRADRGISRPASPRTRSPRSTSRCGTSSARWQVCRSTGSGAGSRIASRPTAAAGGRTTGSRT